MSLHKNSLTQVLQLNLQNQRQTSHSNGGAKCEEERLRLTACDEPTECDRLSRFGNFIIVRLHVYGVAFFVRVFHVCVYVFCFLFAVRRRE